MIPTMIEQIQALRSALLPPPAGELKCVTKAKAQSGEIRRIILEMIQAAPRTRADLVIATCLSDVTVDKHCYALAERGLIRRRTEGNRRVVWVARNV